MRDSFIFYRNFYDVIQLQNKKSQLKLFQAIADYALNGKIPNLNEKEKTIFNLLKLQIDFKEWL